jgi:pimeloyl-ACP methyl ester carboxylesterase
MKISKALFTTMVLLTFVAVTYAQTDTIKYGDNEKAGKYVKVRGFNMYYETYGTGQPVLFIHGNGGSINNFGNQIPYFSKNYKVIVADSRSQGKSFDDGDSLSYEMMADDLNGLLDALHVDSCYVVGWSDGGINGLLLAIRHPGKVKKLAVTGANLWPDSTAVDPFIARWAMNEYNMVKEKPLTPSVKHDLKLLRLLAFEPHITTAQLNKISCPALVIGGDHDVIRPEHTMLIAQSIPESYLWILPNSGHSTPIVYKDLFNATVSDFFNKAYRIIEGFRRFN